MTSQTEAMTSEEDKASLCTQLEEVIKCAICWELPKSPKVLPCQHSFCLRCLYPSYLADLREHHYTCDRIQCPLCRQLFVIPKTGLTSLPSDHRTNAVVELVQRRRYQQRKKSCQVCKVNSIYKLADYFCLTCGATLCSTCNENHKENKLYINHIEIELFLPDSSSLYCVDHPKENIQFYCGDCERPICHACTHTKHATHRTTTFVESSEADSSLEDYLRQFMADKQDEITEHRNEIKKLRLANKRDTEMILKQLSQIRDQISKLREREAELERRLQMHSRVDSRLAEMDDTMMTSLASLEQLGDVIAAAVRPLRQYRKYAVRQPSLQTIQKAFTNIPLPVRDLRLMAAQYDRMTVGYEDDADVDVDGTHYFVDVDERSINAAVRALWRREMTSYDVQFLTDGGRRRLIGTAQTRKWRLFVLDFHGDPDELPPSLSGFADCQCRLTVNNTTSTICLTHKKKADGWCLPFSVVWPGGATETGSIRTSYEQNSLCSVVTTRYDDVVFAFMGCGLPPRATSLRCHSPDGAYRWYRDVSIGSGSGQLISPHYLTVDPLDRIIVSDHYGCQVSIYDNTGRHLVSFPNVTMPDDIGESDLMNIDLPKPAGVCADSKGYIYVAFPTHDVISLFTPNGQFIRHVVVNRGKPRGISICEDRYLAVTTFEDGILLYDLQPDKDDLRQDGGQEVKNKDKIDDTRQDGGLEVESNDKIDDTRQDGGLEVESNDKIDDTRQDGGQEVESNDKIDDTRQDGGQEVESNDKIDDTRQNGRQEVESNDKIDDTRQDGKQEVESNDKIDDTRQDGGQEVGSNDMANDVEDGEADGGECTVNHSARSRDSAFAEDMCTKNCDEVDEIVTSQMAEEYNTVTSVGSAKHTNVTDIHATEDESDPSQRATAETTVTTHSVTDNNTVTTHSVTDNNIVTIGTVIDNNTVTTARRSCSYNK